MRILGWIIFLGNRQANEGLKFLFCQTNILNLVLFNVQKKCHIFWTIGENVIKDSSFTTKPAQMSSFLTLCIVAKAHRQANPQKTSNKTNQL